MKLYRIVLGAVLLGCSAWVAAAADVDGVLMDKMCSMKAVKDGQQAAATHTKECALMPDCQKSGYGVFTSDGRYLKFDAAGDKQAAAELQKTAKKDNLKVKVSGQVDGDSIKVASLKIL